VPTGYGSPAFGEGSTGTSSTLGVGGSATGKGSGSSTLGTSGSAAGTGMRSGTSNTLGTGGSTAGTNRERLWFLDRIDGGDRRDFGLQRERRRGAERAPLQA
jgi:hypothetical protein